MENWKSVVGYEGFYEVSDLGGVRSLTRTVRAGFGSSRVMRGRVLHPAIGSNGYLTVGLCKHGKCSHPSAHTLVLEAFRGARPKGYDSCHENNDRTDNRLCNLRWDTRSKNMSDKIRHGTRQAGSKGPRAVLNDKQVAEIRACRWERGRGRFFARKFGVSESTISLIHLGKIWT